MSNAETLVDGPRSAPNDPMRSQRQAPAAAVALFLARRHKASERMWIHLASSDRRAEEIGRALAGFAPDAHVLVFPPWDCLPYDRASPSHDVMGRRMAVLRRLECESAPRFLLVSPESLVQRIPPMYAAGAVFSVRSGEDLDRQALAAFADAAGYRAEDRVDEPGEIAFLGEVVDVYPADAALPVRVATEQGGLVTELRTYDPLTQRTVGEISWLALGAASELVLAPDAEFAREPGVEHRMGAYYETLPSLFDVTSKAIASQDFAFSERLEEALAQIGDAQEAYNTLRETGDTGPGSPGLYLTREEVTEGLAGWTSRPMDLSDVAAVPSVAGAHNPGRAFCDIVDSERTAGRRVVLAGLANERRALARALSRGLQLAPVPAETWAQVESLEPGSVCTLDIDLDTGFVDPVGGLMLIAASDVLGGRLAKRKEAPRDLLGADPDLRLGDVVMHEDHGIGVLRELQTVEIDGVSHDTLRLEYQSGASVLAPVEEIGRIWRYGAEEDAVSPDRLNGEAWPRRRADLEGHLRDVAERLVELAKARAAEFCQPISPPQPAYARFCARFGYPETPDQGAAIAAVLAELASGRPMDRLVCGDVGFGKTEVALRAAAAVALNGRQVAVCVPTTVLARQHYQTFERRFAGTGIKVAQLSRLVAAREAKAVREAIARGDADIVVGTHALAGEHVSFADLGLMIVDEEQKFGAAVKSRLREMATGGHLLSMTATPIPRTLQAAMIGLQEVSVIASPPARRRPIRTFLAPFDPASVRTALRREKRRGGQSFVVAPRIEDIAPLAERLNTIAPELSVRIAHGDLPPDEVDTVMVGFAEGDGDVLLATNIIESGLDVPRANTMIIWRPDRFGLAQLHQLRGRVGRGRAQGVAYLLHDPEEELSPATRARLSTLEAFDRLGSGLAISGRDLDLRGAGELEGEDQAGHMRMVGAALYQQLLERAIRVARGENVDDAALPVVQLGERGIIPVEYVPDAEARINLYGRLARLTGADEFDAFDDELQDRFGPIPAPLVLLLAQTRLAILARDAGVVEVSAGPAGVAITLPAKKGRACLKLLAPLAEGVELRGDRVMVPPGSGPTAERLAVVEKLLAALVDARS